MPTARVVETDQGQDEIRASLVLDHLNSASSLLRADLYRHWLDGTQPHLHSDNLPFAVVPAEVLPEGFTLERCASGSDGQDAIARCPTATIHIDTNSASTTIRVTADSDRHACELLAEVSAHAARLYGQAEVDTTQIRLWWSQRDGYAQWVNRQIPTKQWSSIEQNYTRQTREALGRLMRLTVTPDVGRLLLWYGDPGTGKTTALGALARAWEPWCVTSYISDPEQLFGDAGYLSSVLTTPSMSMSGRRVSSGPADRSAPPRSEPTAQLLVAEDTDEYLRSTARRQAGAALGRLLNLTDGLLGLGTQTFVLLTTNEELTRLHPALIRPGRCLAAVEFERFSRGEAATWLGEEAPTTSEPVTLADLLQVRGDLTSGPLARPVAPLTTGSYL